MLCNAASRHDTHGTACAGHGTEVYMLELAHLCISAVVITYGSFDCVYVT